jgi:hypothetical protein
VCFLALLLSTSGSIFQIKAPSFPESRLSSSAFFFSHLYKVAIPISRSSATSDFEFPLSTKDIAFSRKSTLYAITYIISHQFHIIPLLFILENTIAAAKNSHKAGISIDVLAEITGLSADEIKQFQEEIA